MNLRSFGFLIVGAFVFGQTYGCYNWRSSATDGGGDVLSGDASPDVPADAITQPVDVWPDVVTVDAVLDVAADRGPLVPRCGDGTCNGTETCRTCSSDCGSCPAALCGNRMCESGESCLTCLDDCPMCPAGVSVAPPVGVPIVTAPTGSTTRVVWSDGFRFLAVFSVEMCWAGRFPRPAFIPAGVLWSACIYTPTESSSSHPNARLTAVDVVLKEYDDHRYVLRAFGQDSRDQRPLEDQFLEVLPYAGAGNGWGFGVVAYFTVPYVGNVRYDYATTTTVGGDNHRWIYAAGVTRPGEVSTRHGRIAMSSQTPDGLCTPTGACAPTMATNSLGDGACRFGASLVEWRASWWTAQWPPGWFRCQNQFWPDDSFRPAGP